MGWDGMGMAVIKDLLWSFDAFRDALSIYPLMPSLSPFACPISSASPIAFAAVVEGVRFSARITLPVDDVTAGAGVPVGSSEMLYIQYCSSSVNRLRYECCAGRFAFGSFSKSTFSVVFKINLFCGFQNQPFLWLKMMMYKRGAVSYEQFLSGTAWQLLSKTGPPFSPSVY